MDVIKKNSFVIEVVGLVAAIVGLWLKFATISVSLFGQKVSESVKFIEGDDSKIVLIAAIVALLLILVEKYKDKVAESVQAVTKIPEGVYKFVPIICTGIALLVTIYDYMDAADTDLGKVTPGIGFFIIVIGTIATIVAIVVDKFISQKQQ